MKNDTLTIDWKLIEQFRSVDYDQEFAEHEEVPEESLFEGFDGWNLSNRNVEILNWILIIAIIIGILIGLFIKFGNFSSSTTRVEIPEEDTIYGVNFKKMLAELEKGDDVYQCIRVRYLYLLRQLHDSRRIYWELYKTPNQYTYEEKSAEFKQLTNIFMKVRYGNYKATAEMYEEEKRLYGIVLGLDKKGGEA